MPRWIIVTVGMILCPILGAITLGLSTLILADMIGTCYPKHTPSANLALVFLLAPAALTVVVTGVAYALVITLLDRPWAIYLAIGIAVLAAAVMVAVAVGGAYRPTDPTPICPAGIPTWWPGWLIPT
ncbi:hypothetical protein QN239_31135 [Mycolicibacterium sp. Y3]